MYTTWAQFCITIYKLAEEPRDCEQWYNTDANVVYGLNTFYVDTKLGILASDIQTVIKH